MKKDHLQLALTTASIILFNLIFWQKPLGINGLIFTIAILAFNLAIRPDILYSRPIIAIGIGTVFTALLVTFHNSAASIVAWVISIFLFMAFTSTPAIRSILYAIPTGVSSIFFSPIHLVKKFFSILPAPKAKPGQNRSWITWRNVMLSALPLIIVVFFFLLFVSGNPQFRSFTDTILSEFDDWFIKLFQHLSFGQILFIFWSIVVCSILIIPTATKYFLAIDEASSDLILRKKRKARQTIFHNAIALKDETKMGTLTVWLVGLLALVVNLVDICTIWFNYTLPEGKNHTQMVHEGTYILIFSIFLSMAILVYFFRSNQNFFFKSKLMRQGAYFWVAQNLILCISVAIRNFHYIDFHGLAYKRIGVIFFLLLTAFGLVTLTLKIRDKKSLYYLLRWNGWATYAVLLLIASFNWDPIIAQHNLNHPDSKNIDYYFLVDLSPKAYPVLDEYDAVGKMSDDYYISNYQRRLASFMRRKEKETWLSWNYSEYRAYEYFNKTYPDSDWNNGDYYY